MVQWRFNVITGNTLVLIAVSKFMKKPSSTYIFLCSVAVSDLLVNVICLPILVSEWVSSWLTEIIAFVRDILRLAYYQSYPLCYRYIREYTQDPLVYTSVGQWICFSTPLSAVLSSLCWFWVLTGKSSLYIYIYVRANIIYKPVCKQARSRQIINLQFVNLSIYLSIYISTYKQIYLISHSIHRKGQL